MALSWMAFRTKELQIYPGNDFYIYAYSDTADGGSSRAQVLENHGIIQFIYRLSSGFAYPYAGMGLDLTEKDLIKNPVKFLDFSKYDTLKVTLRSTLSDELRIQILTHDPDLSNNESSLSYRHLLHHTPTNRRWDTYSVAIQDFVIPEWWFSSNFLKAEQSNKFLERVSNIDFQNSSRMMMGFSDTVEIKSISAVGKNSLLGFGLIIFAGIFLAGAYSLKRIENQRKKIEKELQFVKNRNFAYSSSKKLTLGSQSVKDTAEIVNFIGENYLDSELNLESTCKAIGINRNRLTHLLREEMGLTFKSYLIELRLKEAARLLKTTDLQVAEISQQVGFGNISNFNRNFKDFFKKTPNEYRKKS
ncbi:MAG: helix-turn-helix transcriptional regulator [Fibrobacter sp.]|nr:helix-turn-helix transcriptional regulator [Fibrobacter sp.]